MSAWIVSLMFTVGACTWIYSKLMRRTGNNTQTAVIATVVAGLVILFVSYSITSLIM